MRIATDQLRLAGPALDAYYLDQATHAALFRANKNLPLTTISGVDVLDGFNYEALYGWNGGTLSWDNISATVNPGYGSGSDGLGMANFSGFEELSFFFKFSDTFFEFLADCDNGPLHFFFW